MSRKKGKVYMIGVSGMGMGPLGLYLVGGGWEVVGYDDGMRGDVACLLRKGGVGIDEVGEVPEDCDIVVYSSAVGKGHRVYEEAERKGKVLMRRGEFLARELRGKKVIGVVGSHGKTTTTALLVWVLEKMGYKFGYLLGGMWREKGRMPARYEGESEWVVTEIDESDGTIGEYEPEVSLMVNFDWDHPERYKTEEMIIEAFRGLFKRTSGVVYIPEGCKEEVKLREGVGEGRIKSFGVEKGEVRGRNGEGWLDIEDGVRAIRVRHGMKEWYNVENLVAAMVVVMGLGVGREEVDIRDFSGVKRRQDILYEYNGVRVMGDYAHHPREVRAFIEEAKRGREGMKMVVVFQPHRYSRTAMYAREFGECFDGVDKLVLLPVYAASEEWREEGTTRAIMGYIRREERVALVPFEWGRVKRELEGWVKGGDVQVLFIGAGDIEEMGWECERWLREEYWWRELVGGMGEGSYCAMGEELGSKTTMGVGGRARFYVEPAGEGDLIRVLKAVKEVGMELFILGRGSNLIVPDEGFEGLVVRLNREFWKGLRVEGENLIWAGAGVRLKEVSGLACKMGMVGFEFLEGIPGTLGGSLRMNAGAMGNWLFDVVERVRCVTLDGEVREYVKDEMRVGYRYCKELEEGMIGVGAWLRGVSKGEVEEIKAKLGEYSGKRKKSQPREPSAGCIFKNPEGNYAGKLIEECGLKGARVGGAEVSEVHGNFIINRGGATSGDIVKLVDHIRKRVYEERGVRLEPEVLFMGKEWGEELKKV